LVKLCVSCISFFASDVSPTVSTQSLMLIAVDRFRAVVFPLCAPLISPTLKLCRFVIPATWIIAMAIQSPYLFAIGLIAYPGKLVCTRDWNEAFGESSCAAKLHVGNICCIHLYPFSFNGCTLLYIIVLKLKS